MSIGAYFKTRIWELLLCALAAVALCFTFCSGFFATQPLQPMIWPIVVPCAVAVLALYCIAMTPRSLVIGTVVLAVAASGALLACNAFNPGETPVDDVEGNYCIVLLLVIACSAVTFVLSRKRAGAIVLFVVGSVACGFVEYLYWYGHAGSFILFLAASFGLVVFKTYQESLVDSDSEHLSFGSVSAVAIVLAGLALGCAAACYFFVIAPLEPSNISVKLFTEYRRAEEIELAGTADSAQVLGNQTTNNSTEGSDDTSDSDETEETQASPENLSLGQALNLFGNLGATTALFERHPWLILVIPLAIVLLAICLVMLKRHLRKRKFRRMVSSGNDAAVTNLYLFFLGMFKRLNIECPTGLSLAEFSSGYRDSFQAFERDHSKENTRFDTLTDAYSRVVYGGASATDEERSLFEDYYASFYQNMCRYMGRFKYVLRYFTL